MMTVRLPRTAGQVQRLDTGDAYDPSLLAAKDEPKLAWVRGQWEGTG
jgi:hypothetical protein